VARSPNNENRANILTEALQVGDLEVIDARFGDETFGNGLFAYR